MGVDPAGPFHHHRFLSFRIGRKTVSVCDASLEDGRPCGISYEENVEIAVTRYDRAARREGRR